ncbi:MAG: hypothetical protein KJO23_02640, partial [Bacteroidia bacterium]|nr:hypothetical protein [Bacteroidia bacterium]
MNYLRVVLVMIFTLGIFTQVTAQPYTLDEEIKPIQLQLKEDKKRKGAQGLAANVTIDKEPQHFYVKGLDMFQFVDVFIFSNLGNPNFKVELVKNTWNEVEESATTGASDKGIINFKLRTYGDFGLKVLPSGKKVNYTIVVYASPPIEEHLGSAFTKSTDSEETEDASEEGSNKSSGSSNTLLYVIIGIALLVIGFLGAKLMSRKKATLILLLLSLGIFSAQNALAQGEIDLDPGVEEVDIDDIRSAEYREW